MYATEHPHVKTVQLNTDPQVKKMIDHVLWGAARDEHVRPPATISRFREAFKPAWILMKKKGELRVQIPPQAREEGHLQRGYPKVAMAMVADVLMAGIPRNQPEKI